MRACFSLFLFLFLAFRASNEAKAAPTSAAPLWITAYYPGWQKEHLVPHDIDFRALTHLVHFAVLPESDGRLDWAKNGLDPKHSRETIAATHAAGKKILLGVGGEQSAPQFRTAIGAATRPKFVAHLIEALQTRGYDGLDIDMEPIEAADAPLYALFIRELRAGMRRQNPRSVLTAAVSDSPALFKTLQDQFDQINVMTYDLSGPWEGWPTWHNAPLSSGALQFPTVARPLPSVESKIGNWLAAGIAPSKLGLGLAFYGYLWTGANRPNQNISHLKTEQIGYFDIMQKYFSKARLAWDAIAEVPYLGIDEPGIDSDRFISFDNERSLRLKILFARRMKLGGAIIWELGDGYRKELPAGKRDPLLQAVREAAFGPK